MRAVAFERYLRDGDAAALLRDSVAMRDAVEPARYPEVHRICDIVADGQAWRVTRIVDIETGRTGLFLLATDAPRADPGVPYFLRGPALLEWVRAEVASPSKSPAPTRPETLDDALGWLRQSGAPPRLLRHAQLVAKVADELARELERVGATVDRDQAVIGAALHDVGKITHPAELTGPGKEHELAGERLLLSRGVPSNLARFCRTHGVSPGEMPEMEDVIVALADKLWRGARKPNLEAALVDRVAAATGGDRWAVFNALDAVFERIASRGEERLADQRDASAEAPR